MILRPPIRPYLALGAIWAVFAAATIAEMVGTHDYGGWDVAAFFLVVFMLLCIFVAGHRIELIETAVIYRSFLHRTAVVPLSEILLVESGRFEVGGRRYGIGRQTIRITFEGEQPKKRKSIILAARLFSTAALDAFLAALEGRGIPVKSH